MSPFLRNKNWQVGVSLNEVVTIKDIQDIPG